MMPLDEQIEELRRTNEGLQLHLISAIHLAEESMLPLPSQIDKWRHAIGWAPLTWVMADDEYEPPKIGTMRLGGMTPATARHNLPVTFRISKTIESNNHVILFCNHHAVDGEELIWVDQDTITVRGRDIKLRSHPSYRVCWDTFIIHKSDWTHESGRTPSA